MSFNVRSAAFSRMVLAKARGGDVLLRHGRVRGRSCWAVVRVAGGPLPLPLPFMLDWAYSPAAAVRRYLGPEEYLHAVSSVLAWHAPTPLFDAVGIRPPEAPRVDRLAPPLPVRRRRQEGEGDGADGR